MAVAEHVDVRPERLDARAEVHRAGRLVERGREEEALLWLQLDPRHKVGEAYETCWETYYTVWFML